MTNKTETADISIRNQPLTSMQKFMFGLICWGVQTRSQVKSFQTNGYVQKYRDAKKATQTGLIIYATGIILFILLILVFK